MAQDKGGIIEIVYTIEVVTQVSHRLRGPEIPYTNWYLPLFSVAVGLVPNHMSQSFPARS